jgi:hypothetical protein
VSDQYIAQLEQRLNLTPPPPEAEGDRVAAPDGAPDLPGWEPVRVDREPDATPPTTTAFVRSTARGAGEVVLRIDVYELPSAGEAHRHLLRVLTDFQSPLLRVLEGSDIGDVAVAHGETAAVLRRANLVVVVRNAGADVVPVLDVARMVDRSLR